MHDSVATVRVRNLGSLVVERDGDAIEMGVSRQAALLARLTMEPQRQVSSAALIAAAWGPEGQVTAASLDSQLWRLRNRLDPGRDRATSVLVREGSGYRLHLDPSQVDSAYFEQLTVEIDQMLGDDAAAATLLPLVDRALALWRGRAFEPIADHLDVGPTAARLAERKEQLQERRAELLMRSGQAEAALAEVISLMADAPYRERLWAIRIRALADLGRTDEALASYRAARDLLSDQLGLDPGAELQKLQADILAGGSTKPEVRPTAGSNGQGPRAGGAATARHGGAARPIPRPPTAVGPAGRAVSGHHRRPGRMREDEPGHRRRLHHGGCLSRWPVVRGPDHRQPRR